MSSASSVSVPCPSINLSTTYPGDTDGEIYGLVCPVIDKEIVVSVCVDLGSSTGCDGKIGKSSCHDGLVYSSMTVLICIGKGAGITTFNSSIVDCLATRTDFKGENVKTVGCVC